MNHDQFDNQMDQKHIPSGIKVHKNRRVTQQKIIPSHGALQHNGAMEHTESCHTLVHDLVGVFLHEITVIGTFGSIGLHVLFLSV